MKINNSQPILSICIPIYNRLNYLERMLSRFLENSDLFVGQIQLIISDNCSKDDLKSCCENYLRKGLRLIYHRNETNIGPDGNFDWCFHHADGKYLWLLGSDDIPVEGLLVSIMDILSKGDFGLVHLSTSSQKEKLQFYHHDKTILADINVWITFMSSNIIRTVSVKSFNLSEYYGSFMIQVPAYLNACLTADDNILACLGQLFEKDSDGANNGGYNLLTVFVENLFSIYQQFVSKGMLSKNLFEFVKRKEYTTWLVYYVVNLMLLRTSQRKNFKMEKCWTILLKHYGLYPYFYFFTAKVLVRSIVNKLQKK